MKSVFCYDFLLVVFTKTFCLVRLPVRVAHRSAILVKNRTVSLECGSQSVGVERWVRPAIKHSQDVTLVGEARSIVFVVSLGRVSVLCSTFYFFFIRCFSLFCFNCVLSSKVDYCFGIFFDFLVFHFVSI